VPVLGLGVLAVVTGLAAALLSGPVPAYDRILDNAARLIEQQRCEDALGVLNEKILPFADRRGFTTEHRRRMHLLRARAIYLGQQLRELDLEENHRNVLTEYLRAEENHASLSPLDTEFLADTYISLGRFDKALMRVSRLDESERDRRNELYKRMILAKLDEPELDFGWTISRRSISGESSRSWMVSSTSSAPEMAVRFAWGSRSMRMTLSPISTSAAPRLRTVAVLPTPPF
jgi:hypothetical protein